MKKPCLVCADDEPSALHALVEVLEARFGDAYEIVPFPSGEKALEGMDVLARQDRKVPLILCDQAMPGLTGDRVLDVVNQRHPDTLKVLVTEQADLEAVVQAINRAGLDRYIQKPWEAEGLFLTVQSLLTQAKLKARLAEKQRALERKNAHLEALHTVGVGLASTFDIDSILQRIQRAVTRLIGDGPIDVFYSGSRRINARPRWLPASPLPGNLSADTRRELENKLATMSLSQLSLSPDGPELRLIPIARHDEILGLVVVRAERALGKEDLDLLSILSLQAATALHNIHLNQGRLHLERLSAFGTMIGSLVHDFRSPLTAVRGYAGMLNSSTLRREDREEYTARIKEECDRLNGMINELLEFTRSGRSQLVRRHIRAGTFLADLNQTIAAHCKDQQIEFELELGHDGPLFIDPARMSRAVLNVVSNACQAMNGKGRLVLRTYRAEDRVVLEFEDEGCGIPEEIRHRIFEPFFSYRKAQGIGLGMAITRK
ncbi:MAG: histidine kinase dimerization/phospho-acceptor domain-containing protein, partial [Acidobacteriota bacterium]